MSCVLTKGRIEPCKNNIGGVKNVYFFPFVDYAYNLIVGTKGVELTSFPSTTVYKYEVVNGSFSETINNEDNGISYSQSLTFELFKQDLLTTNELNVLNNIDFRYIVEFNDGKLKVGGLFNGANISNLVIKSGGSKDSLNGYSVTITSSEEYQAAFIDDLEDAGFNIDAYLLLEDFTNLLLETSEFLALE